MPARPSSRNCVVKRPRYGPTSTAVPASAIASAANAAGSCDSPTPRAVSATTPASARAMPPTVRNGVIRPCSTRSSGSPSSRESCPRYHNKPDPPATTTAGNMIASPGHTPMLRATISNPPVPTTIARDLSGATASGTLPDAPASADEGRLMAQPIAYSTTPMPPVRVRTSSASRTTYVSTPYRLAKPPQTPSSIRSVDERANSIRASWRCAAGVVSISLSCHRTAGSTSGVHPDTRVSISGFNQGHPRWRPLPAGRTVQHMTHVETEPAALPPPTPEGPLPERRWARSDDRIVLGVAGGLARALAIDPLVIRIAFVVLALFSGVGIAFYVAGLLLLADSPSSPSPSLIRRVVGIAAALISARWLFGGGATLPNADWVIAVALLGAAVALWRGRLPAIAPGASPTAETATSNGSSGEQWTEWATRRRERPRPPRSALGLLTIGAATVVGASVWLIAADAHNRGALAFGWATVVIGCGLLVGTFVGRARWLIAPAALTAVAAVVASALSFAGVDLNHPPGSKSVFVSSGGTVAAKYRSGVGDFELVLTDYPSDVRTSVEVGVGTLTVVVPDDARVQIDARVGIGMIDALGVTRSGYRRILTMDDNPDGAPVVNLTLRVGVGEIDVRRGSFLDIPRPFLSPAAPQLFPGGQALQSFADGTVLFADGSIDFGDGGRIEPDGSFQITIVEQRADGSVQLENGAVVRADGTVVTPGGFVVNRSRTIASAPTTTTVKTTADTTAAQP